MKTLFTFLLPACVAPMALWGQPVLTINEFYNIGDAITMISCDPTSVSVGTPGVAETWDFSHLAQTGTPATTTVLRDTAAMFSTSNIMIVQPDGTVKFVQENSTDSYVNGSKDPSTGTITHYNNYDLSVRPFTYNTVKIDTYGVTIPETSTTGLGRLVQTGDAYGTLILPSATFANVLRIKKVQTEVDTTGTVVRNSSTISYLWFDVAHKAPLFRLDSTINLSGITQTAMYLSIPTGIKSVALSQVNFDGYLGNNELLLTGDFEVGKVYDVTVYNLIGSRELNYEFSAAGSTQRFVTDRPLNPGIYIIVVAAKNDPTDRKVIKVIKQ